MPGGQGEGLVPGKGRLEPRGQTELMRFHHHVETQPEIGVPEAECFRFVTGASRFSKWF